jgi:hypothetical protein
VRTFEHVQNFFSGPAFVYPSNHGRLSTFSQTSYNADQNVMRWRPHVLLHWFLLLGHVGVAFVEHRLFLLILFIILKWSMFCQIFYFCQGTFICMILQTIFKVGIITNYTSMTYVHVLIVF